MSNANEGATPGLNTDTVAQVAGEMRKFAHGDGDLVARKLLAWADRLAALTVPAPKAGT